MQEAEKKLARLKTIIQKQKVDALLISDKNNTRWFHGFNEGTGFVLATKNKVLIFVSPLSSGNFLKINFPINFQIIPLVDDMYEMIKTEVTKLGIRSLGFEPSLPYKSYTRLAQKGVTLVSIDNVTPSLRAIKYEYEIDFLKKAERITKKTFKYIEGRLKAGMKEREIARMMDDYSRGLGADGLSFDPIVAVGSNSSIPHYATGGSRLKESDILLIDYGVKTSGYHADMTRTYLFGHERGGLADRAYRAVVQALLLAKNLYKDDSDVRIIDRKVRTFIRGKSFEPYMHSLGHGLGLDIHEVPYLNEKSKTDYLLKKGMVVTAEPAIYIDGKFGVRMEDMVYI